MANEGESFLGVGPEPSNESRGPATARLSTSQVLFSFKGRIGRGTLWAVWGCMFVASLLVALINQALATSVSPEAPLLLVVPYVLFACCVGLALQVKRWHDLEYTGWITAFAFVPFVNLVYLLVAFVYLGCIEGTRGPNKYGPDPLARGVPFGGDIAPPPPALPS